MRRAALCAVLAAVAVAGCGGGDSHPTLSVAWSLAPAQPVDGRALRVLYTFPGRICDFRFLRATAQETARAVTVTVLAHYAPVSEACILVLGGGSTTVRLRARLGHRRLLHAPLSRVPRQ